MNFKKVIKRVILAVLLFPSMSHSASPATASDVFTFKCFSNLGENYISIAKETLLDGDEVECPECKHKFVYCSICNIFLEHKTWNNYHNKAHKKIKKKKGYQQTAPVGQKVYSVEVVRRHLSALPFVAPDCPAVTEWDKLLIIEDEDAMSWDGSPVGLDDEVDWEECL